jgi:hypothetical protein
MFRIGDVARHTSCLKAPTALELAEVQYQAAIKAATSHI